MGNILLSNPFVQLYVVWVAVALVLAFWTGESRPSRGKNNHGRPANRPPHDGTALPTRRLPGAKVDCWRLPVRKVQTSCTAEYTARFSERIARIRLP
jgi:hypothetical protein